MNRYVVKGGATPFEVATGRPYSGKVAEFGEPVLAYVYAKNKPKGGARWEQGVFLSKTNLNDMFIIWIGNSLMLTKAIKRIYSDWHDHSHLHFDFTVQSWMVEVIGNRTKKKVKASALPEPQGVEVLEDGTLESPRDEAASDPESEGADETVELVIPESTTLQNLTEFSFPLTPMPMVATPVPVPAPGSVLPPVQAQGVQPMEVGEAADSVEPGAKRRKLTVRTVGAEDFFHVDEEMENEFNYTMDDDDVDDFWDADDLSEGALQPEEDDEADQLWFPAGDEEPQVSEEELRRLDGIADRVEVMRLSGMGVLLEPGSYTGELASPLSAKFVRSWRKKQRDGQPMFLRRSRLVAREFAFVESRYDVYAPASASSCQRLIPALGMCGVYDGAVLGSLDITDAYLTVKQQVPRNIKLMAEPTAEMVFDTEGWVIDRCLPGQRDEARRWYDHFVNVLKEEFKAEVCLEQPSMLKIPGQGILLLHVDDVMFLLNPKFLEDEFKPRLGKHFKFSMNYAPRTGGSFEFLKKTFEISPGYKKLTIYPETKHIRQIYDTYTKHNGKPARLHKTPVNAQLYATDHTQQLGAEQAGVYRSLVGAILYISHDRGDVQYAAKSLAAYLKEPTKHAWMSLGRLVGYLKATETYANSMVKTVPNMNLFAKTADAKVEGETLFLESFSDADWDCKCTSAGVHYLAGNAVYSTSRSQKAISLSSTESEWYAAISCAIDTIYLSNIITFLARKPTVVMRVDNSAVISISTKIGPSRLKRITGKLLWLQNKVAEGFLRLSPVKTTFNVADVGTKGLGRVKHASVTYLLGMTNEGEAVGEHEFHELNKQELMKQQDKRVVRHVQLGQGF